MTDPAFEELADLFIDIAREIRMRSANAARGVPLNQTQSQVMRYVHHNPGCTPSEIADSTGLRRANVSPALSELKDLGFVVTRPREEDGRSVSVEATMHAEQTIHDLRESWGGLLERAWKDHHGLDLDELSTFRSHLDRMMASLAESR